MCIHFHVMFLLIYLVCPCRQQRKHRLVVCAKKVETKKNSVFSPVCLITERQRISMFAVPRGEMAANGNRCYISLP